MVKSKFFDYLILALILIGAFYVRYEGVTGYYFHTDELIHSFIAHGRNFGEVFSRGLRETHPPLGHFIRHIEYMFSDSIIASRLLSVSFGMVAIITAYFIGKEIRPASYLGLVLASFTAFTPIAVIYTTDVRNYGIFLAFLMLTYYFFLRYAGGRKSSFWFYIIFSWLACATHFSGFIFTFALLATLISLHLKDKSYKRACAVVAAHILHLLLLAGLFYFYYIKSNVGQGWYNFFVTSSGTGILQNSNLLIGLLSIYCGFFIFNMSFVLLAIIASVAGVYLLLQQNRAVGFSIIAALILQSILAVLHIYPFNGLRYGFYLLPFIILPLSYFVADFFARFKATPRIFAAIFIPALLAFCLYASQRNIYFEHSGEFSNTNQSFQKALDYIEKNVSAGDVILSNKGSWLHLLYLSDRNNSGYYPQSLGKFNFNGLQMYFREQRNYLEYTNKTNFYNFLAEVRPQTINARNLWFVIFGTSDYALFTVYNCPDVKPYIYAQYEDRGVLIYKLDKSFFEKHFFSPDNLAQSCFNNSKQPFFGGLFGESKINATK